MSPNELPRSSSQKPVTVMGATGAIGRRIITALLEAGRPVRGTSRDPEKASLPRGTEVFLGDLANPSTFAKSFSGATQLVLLSTPETIDEILFVAKRKGIEEVAMISSAAVTAGYDTTYNAVMEETVRSSGLSWSIVRPGEFATNSLLIWGPAIRTQRRVVEPFPDQVGYPVHESDVADVVVSNLSDHRGHGRITTIVGPESLTKREQVVVIAEAIEESISLDEVTADEARAFYRDQGGFAAANADFLFGFESYDGVQASADMPHDTSAGGGSAYLVLDQITGAAARTYRRWAYDHASDFR